MSELGLIPTDPYVLPTPRPASFRTEPSPLPDTLVVGRPVRVTVIPSGEDAQPDRRVEYFSNASAIRWVIPDPPCPQNSCADLVGVSPTPPYWAFVRVEICPPDETALCPSGPILYITVVAP
jgi:hypothetical protein